MKKQIPKRYIIGVIVIIVFMLVVFGFSFNQAVKMGAKHDKMMSHIDSMPSKQLQMLKERYPDGYTIYYSLSGYSGFYPYESADTLYEKFEMERWAVEISDDDSQIRFVVPEIGWNPEFDDMEMGGWILNVEQGSSITLTNPRLNPDSLGTIYLELFDKFDEGLVFVIAQPLNLLPNQ